MTNSIAATLVLLIVGLIVADWLLLDFGLLLRIAREMNGLIEYLSFWR